MSGKVSGWVKGFVVWHLLAITIWSVPNPRPELASGEVAPHGSDHIVLFFSKSVKELSPVKGYLLSTGTWQYWDMFAPDPVQTDYWGDAEITFLDGTRKPFLYPKIADLPLVPMYLSERFRKFYERAHTEENSYLWPVFGQRIALLHYTDRKNPPIRVLLTRHFLNVPRAGSGKGDTRKMPYNAYSYYVHIVDQKSLDADRNQVNASAMIRLGREGLSKR